MDYSGMTDADLFKLMVWRESRNAETLDWLAVAYIPVNRAKQGGWWGHDLRSVILCPEQFSSFNPGDPNETKMPNPDDAADWEAYQKISAVCDKVLSGTVLDPTQNGMWYIDHSIAPPSWTTKLQVALKTPYFTFYREPIVGTPTMPDLNGEIAV